ncbi:DUF4350 domain-containing protein [Streptosporangium soli]|nr:DUF4350 domain-containing protein [Streptosporangium sp. KLBMP 9127]
MTATSPTVRSIWRGGRGPLLVGLIVLAVAVGGVLLAGIGGGGRSLDPGDSTLAGSSGLAELLRHEGVRVERVTSADAAARAATAGSLLLVTDLSFLRQDEVDRLAGLPGDRLLIGPGAMHPSLAPGLAPLSGTEDTARVRSREPECALPAAVQAGSAYMGGYSLRGPPGAIGCYPADGRPTLVSYQRDGRTITAVGDGQFLTNLRLTEDGNAALGASLAGTRPTLVWLTAPETLPELPGPEGKSFTELMPAGVSWAVIQLVIAVALVAFWRGRRLGPVVAERLPVVVRAAETVEGRGRLYRARRARDRAAAALRAGALHRLMPRLGLVADSGHDAIITAIAVRTGQDAGQVGTALYGGPPADDAGLVALAAYLDTLERQVRDS